MNTEPMCSAQECSSYLQLGIDGNNAGRMAMMWTVTLIYVQGGSGSRAHIQKMLIGPLLMEYP